MVRNGFYCFTVSHDAFPRMSLRPECVAGGYRAGAGYRVGVREALNRKTVVGIVCELWGGGTSGIN